MNHTSERRIDLVGVETELYVFDDEGNPVNTVGYGELMNGAAVLHGDVDSDAGAGLCEIITKPCDSMTTAASSVAALSKLLMPNCIYFTPFRPSWMQGGGVWADKARYRVLRKALRVEVGELSSHVDAMTNMAATHLNISGKFKPVGPDGLFVSNVLRHAVPHMAAYVHDQIGCGHGHLAFWSKFALAGRFPEFGRWHASRRAFKKHFEGLPRLLKKVGDDEWAARPSGETQVLGNEVDHGVYWDFARPKPNKSGGWYMELRFLPSMGPDELLKYGQMSLDVVELLLEWFDRNGRRPVCSLEEAGPAFDFVHRRHPEFFPATPPDEATWKGLLHR